MGVPSNNIEFFNKKYTYCIYTEYNTNYIIFNIDDNLIISKSVLEDDDDTIIYDAYFKLNESLIDEEKSLKEFFLKKNYGLKNFFLNSLRFAVSSLKIMFLNLTTHLIEIFF